jgi:hypothetical protein
MVMLALTLVVAGCRRKSDTPQPPVSIMQERDFIFKPSDGESVESFKPRPKKPDLKLRIAELVMKPTGEFEFPPEVRDLEVRVTFEPTKDEDLKTKEKLAEKQVDSIRKEIEDDIRKKKDDKLLEDMGKIAEIYRDFCRANEKTVEKCSLDNFKTEVRRKDTHLRRLLDEKKVEIVIAVDWFFPGQVITRATLENGVHTLAIGPKTKDFVPGMWKSNALDLMIQGQELRVLRNNYLDYMKMVKSSNDPKKCSLERFEKYLHAKAAPSVAKLAAEKTVVILDPKWIDLRMVEPNPNDPEIRRLQDLANSTWIIYRSAAREISNPDGTDKRKIHDSIMWNGFIGPLSPEQAIFIVQRLEEKAKK